MFGAEKIQELANVISHLTRQPMFQIGPVVVTSTVVNTWIIMLVLFIAVFFLTRRFQKQPRGVQTFLEIALEFINSLIDDGMGRTGRVYLPLVGSLFIMILVFNLSWFIPGMVPPTTDIMTTAALGVTSIIMIQAAAIRKKGIREYLHHFCTPMPLLLPMNIVEEVVKPFSLAIRLFGNMFGEKLITNILFILVPVLVPTPVMLLGVLMGAIQAYIFSMLTITYLAEATHD
ncbi:MAG: F0F1 ATP synthase subunit A [Limnochordia bacterium]